MKKYDIVIIGGGPVGLFAAFYAGRRGMSTLIIEASDTLGGQPNTIYSEKWILDIPGQLRVTGYDLTKRLIEQAQSPYLTTLLNTKVISCQGSLEQGFTITCQNVQDNILASSVLIATGVGEITPQRIGLPREDTLKGVHYYLQSKSIITGKKVVVLGGGDSALDWADFADGVASETHLVHRRDEFRAQEQSVRRLMASNVNLHLNGQVAALHGDDQLKGVDIQHKDSQLKHIPCDVLVVSFGFKIQLGGLENWGLTIEQNGVVVDNTLETNIPGIFAAGDVAHTPGLGNSKLIAIGFGQATIAVNAAKTRIDPKAKFFPGHSTNWK